jgi:hypothetical protein
MFADGMEGTLIEVEEAVDSRFRYGLEAAPISIHTPYANRRPAARLRKGYAAVPA